MINRRRRFKQTKSLIEGLHQFSDGARAEAGRMTGEARNALMKKIEVTERAMKSGGYLSSREITRSCLVRHNL